jgi:exo-1,4-beta-D-glucosaminidase
MGMVNGLTVQRVIVMAFAALAAAATAGAESLPLNDNWAIQSAAKIADAKIADTGEAISVAGFAHDGWYPTSVPATVLAALVENKVYPDPFYGDNVTKIPGYKPKLWLVMDETSPFFPSWWYRTEFDAPASFSGKNIVLHLDGINLRANVWLNGKLVAADDKIYGMHRRYELDVNEFVRPGEKNCLAIEITAPGHIPEPAKRTKQIECTTGWDDHNPQPPDLNMGIWQKVYLTATGPVALRHPYVRPDLEVPSLATARLTVAAHAINKTDQPVKGKLTGKIELVEFARDVELAPHETKVVEFTPEAFPQLVFSNPRVWWPVNLGKQELYDAAFSFDVDGTASDTAATTFGIRNATTYINDEGWRAYKINGQDILIRGGAWMTSDMLLRLTPKRYDALVRYAREAGLNMLRSEGFSIRETEEFYNACDKYGVMVTQQIFGRSIPDEPLAIACIEDMMLRIRNHPSLVHFLGHDETFPTPTLDAAYKDLIARLIPDRTYQPQSGAFDIEEHPHRQPPGVGLRDARPLLHPPRDRRLGVRAVRRDRRHLRAARIYAPLPPGGSAVAAVHARLVAAHRHAGRSLLQRRPQGD